MGDASEVEFQRPTTGRLATSFAEQYAIACHPAFRIGFLDAQQRREFDHEAIMARIVAETPARALERIGWPWAATPEEYLEAAFDMFTDKVRANRQRAVELAQYRYEEGRWLQLAFGCRCRAWGHPDYPPKSVMDFIIKRAETQEPTTPKPL
jgi:hypothetical protein